MAKKTVRTKTKVDFVRRWDKPHVGPRGTKKYITSTELRRLIPLQLGPKLHRNFGLYVADAKYYCTPIADARQIIKASAVDRHTWIQDRFDCDDFAHVLKAHFAEAAYKDGRRRAAHCFGIVWGYHLPGHHAINWMVNSDLVLRFIEPQTDRVYRPGATDKDIYFMLV